MRFKNEIYALLAIAVMGMGCVLPTEEDATSDVDVAATQSALVEDVVMELFGSKRDHYNWNDELFISIARLGPYERPTGAFIQYDARVTRYITDGATLQVVCGVKGRRDIPAIVHYEVYSWRELFKGLSNEPPITCESGFEVLYARGVVDIFR